MLLLTNQIAAALRKSSLCHVQDGNKETAMKDGSHAPSLKNEESARKDESKEVSVVALMTVREMLGWSKKTLVFAEENLAEILKRLTTRDGKNLFDVLVREDGAVRAEYMVWLNNRPVKQEHSLNIPLSSGDRIVVMPIIRFAAGG